MLKLLVGLFVVVLVIAAGLLVAPFLIDWTANKELVERRLGVVLNRQVTIGGAVDFSLLPTPLLTVEDVVVRNPAADPAAPPELTAGTLDMRVSLLPLLAGRVAVERMILVDPVLRLDAPDERPPWAWDVSFMRGLNEGFTGAAALERVTIENGGIMVRDPVGRETMVLNEVFGQASAESLSGPGRLVGSFRLGDVGVTFDIDTGRVTGGAVVPVSARFGIDGVDGEVGYAGLLAPEGHLRGELEITGTDLSGLLQRIGIDGWLVEAVREPYAVNADVQMSPDSLDFNTVTFDLGDTSGTGGISIAMAGEPRTDVAVSLNRVDLEALLGRVGGWPAVGGWMASQADGFALPDWGTTTLDLSIDALDYQGARIRQFYLESRLDGEGLRIGRLSAQLPGSTDVTLTGRLRADNGFPLFEQLGIDWVTGDLRRLITWLNLPAPDVSPTRLRRFSASGRLHGTPWDFQLTGLDLSLDNARLSGALRYVDQGQPGLGLRAVIDVADIDSYRSGSETLPEILADWDLRRRLADLVQSINLNLALDIGRLRLAGEELQGLVLEATAEGGRIGLGGLSVADFGGAEASISGFLGDVSNLSELDLSLAVDVPDLDQLAAVVDYDLPEPLGQIDPVVLTGTLRGSVDDALVQASGEVDGGQIEVRARVQDWFDEPTVGAAVTLRHPDALRPIALLAPEYQPPADLGPLVAVGMIESDAESIRFADVEVTIGQTPFGGHLDLLWPDGEGVPTRFDLDVRADVVAVEDYLPDPGSASAARGQGLMGTSLPLAWLSAVEGTAGFTGNRLDFGDLSIDEPAARVAVTDGRLTVDGFSGRAFDGQFGMTGSIGAEGDAEVSFNLVAADLAEAARVIYGVAPGTGVVEFGLTGTSRGLTLSSLVADLEGEGLMSVRDGTLSGLDVAAVGIEIDQADDPLAFLQAVRSALDSGETPFATLNAPFDVSGGRLSTDSLRITTEPAIGIGDASVDLVAGEMDMTVEFSLYAQPDAPPFGVNLVGRLNDPTRRLQVQALQAFVAQRAARALSDRFRMDETPPDGDPLQPEPDPGEPEEAAPPEPLPPPNSSLPPRLAPSGEIPADPT